jgi:hypothetical protein
MRWDADAACDFDAARGSEVALTPTSELCRIGAMRREPDVRDARQ